MNRKILLLLFHPRFEDSFANKQIVDTAKDFKNVMIKDEYELYPDMQIDVDKEQSDLLAHEIIIWQHPFYWYSCPPLMKQWIDLVLEHGWAYGKGGDKLSGKMILNSITSGGKFTAYQPEGSNRYTYRELLRPFEQTARLCRMIYLPPMIVPGANRITEIDIAGFKVMFTKLLKLLSQEHLDMSTMNNIEYFNDFPF
jgi:glutathione-regulated potassium-efflux system ancillary protein KefG